MNKTTQFTDLISSPLIFREFIDFTARKTGFRSELIEKDFYCSYILSCISDELPENVVFKGGTSLSKIHTKFYRLSEDLDFSIDISHDATRSERRKLIEPVKQIWAKMKSGLPEIRESDAISGANNSTQYVGSWSYRSLITGIEEKVKMEFGLREKLLLPLDREKAGTLLLNAINMKECVTPFTIQVMSIQEVWSEKVRAALSRREPAIRDFFDLDFATLQFGLNLEDESFLKMVAQKMSIPGNGEISLTDEKLKKLERQITGQLQPVLRSSEYNKFDLNRIWEKLRLFLIKFNAFHN